MSLFDLFFPKRCVQCKKFGSYLCPNCFSYIAFTDSMICTVCNRQAIGGLTHPVCQTRYTIDGVFPSLVYKGVVKKLVYTFKYPPYLTDLQTLLVELFYEGIIQKEQFYRLLTQENVFVPIPLHKKKLRKRGYNQACLLAEGLSQCLNFPIVDCLERVKETKTQVGLSKELRAENIKSAFALKPAFLEQVRGLHHVFLVDDVATSGATMLEAAKVLKKSGVKTVWGLTLAHGE
ncbi:MAG: ComF family protein [Candidatus Levyibacteriota bacterium]